MGDYRTQSATAVPPALAAPTVFNGTTVTESRVPAGFALRLISTTATGVGSLAITVEMTGGKSFSFNLGPDGSCLFRAADGFAKVSSLDSSLIAWLVEDTGTETSNIADAQAAQESAFGGIQTAVNLGSVPFPINANLAILAVNDFAPIAAEAWELDVLTQGPSAGVVGVVQFWTTAGKVARFKGDIALDAVGAAITALNSLLVVNPNVVTINVTAAGAAGGQARISGRRVA